MKDILKPGFIFTLKGFRLMRRLHEPEPVVILGIRFDDVELDQQGDVVWLDIVVEMRKFEVSLVAIVGVDRFAPKALQERAERAPLASVQLREQVA